MSEGEGGNDKDGRKRKERGAWVERESKMNNYTCN